MVKIFGGLMLVVALAAGAQDAPKAVPDAQVESNVLKALANSPDLSTQNIQTSVVYGTVTLTGNVHDEAARSKAENLASRAEGVKKVIDELTLGDQPAPASDPNAGVPQEQGGQLQSDGTYAPGPATDNAPNQGGMGQEAQNQPAMPQGGDSQGAPPARRPLYENQPPQGPPQGGQQAGLQVTVPAGALLRIRINRGIDSNHIKPGTPFDGTVLSDVAADGAVAIPRGATVQGVVVAAEKTKALSGRGGLSLQINSIQLAGKTYPLQSDVWQREGADKTTSTVNRAIGLGAVGALFGAVAGGGAGAAIGAGIGGAAGVASSAGSPRGQIIVPPESVLVFHVEQPATLQTVSEQEMARLSYAAGPSAPPAPRVARRAYYPYPSVYYYGR